MKKISTILICFSLMASMFAGCGGSGSSSSAAPTPDSTAPASSESASGSSEASADGKTEISVSLWDYSNLEYHKTMIAAFEEKYPQYSVNVIETTSDDYDTKIQIMLSGGDTVDVVYTKGLPALSALIEKGQLLPLNDYISASNIDGVAYSGLLDSLQKDGNTYAMPFRKDNNMVFFNKDLFDENGVAYPEDGMTMEDYRELAKKMTFERADGSKVYGAHVHTWPSNVYNFPRRMDQFDILSESRADQLRPYYETVLAMQNEDKSIMDYAALKAGNIHYSGVFYNQEVAMQQMGTWFVNMLVENVEFNWGVCSLPNVSGEGNTSGIGGVTPISINAKATNPDEAWEFVNFVAGAEGAAILAGTGILPGYTDSSIVEIIAALPGVPENISDYLSIDKIVIEQPLHPMGYELYEVVLKEEHDLIMSNAASLDDGLNELQERANDLLG